MQLINRKIIFISIFLAFFSNVDSQNVDNILKACFYSQHDTSYLILHESHFHPTSGSYEKGKMWAQGYTTSKILVYNLNNGSLTTQKEMGMMDSTEACFILGCSNNNLWLYSYKHKSGLQSLKPLTLEKNISQATIYKSLNISFGRFIDPNWQDMRQYFGFDPVQQKLIVTNTLRQQYYIDAETFATQPLTEKIELNQPDNNYLEETAVFKDSTWTLDGYEQMNFKCGDITIDQPTFLYGKFIMEQNKLRLFHHFLHVYESNLAPQGKSQNTVSEVDSLQIDAKNNIESLIKGEKPDDVLLQTDPHCFYVYSKSDKVPEADIKISKIRSVKFGEFTEVWSVSPQGMFYNVAQARNTRIFRQYFGDFVPEFNYQLFQVFDNKLVIIYLTQVCCIDINTGKIIFQFRLR